jgi:hypothetical protein
MSDKKEKEYARRAECYHCGSVQVSRDDLCDFVSRPNKPTDLFYCGMCLKEPWPETEVFDEEAYTDDDA